MEKKRVFLPLLPFYFSFSYLWEILLKKSEMGLKAHKLCLDGCGLPIFLVIFNIRAFMIWTGFCKARELFYTASVWICQWTDWSDFSLPTPSSLKIYDIQTGNKLLTLFNPDLANNYKRNCATFNPTDDLVLNDGVLWDVRSAQAIHKFDKFNMNISGVFHPNGLEVIINTEIVSFASLPSLPFVI